MLHDIEIGTTESGELVRLDAEARKRNILAIGPPGTGKSKWLEDVTRQIITNDEGLFLLDGDGTTYDAIVEWCAEHRVQRDRSIHLIDFREEQWGVGLDSFRVSPPPAANPSAEMLDAVLLARIDAVVANCHQIFDGEETYRTPRLRKCLRSACYALAVNELTLAELTTLTTASDVHGLRKLLTERLPNEGFRSVWADFNALSRHEFAEQFESTISRLIEIIGYPLVRRMLGQRKRVLDFSRAMDQGEIILCRAAPSERHGLSRDSARLIGTLLMGEMVVSGVGRDEAAGIERPFNVIIDEAPQFLRP